MKTIDIARRAGRNLREAKLRTFLTALAISVGAFTITLALAAGTGARQYTNTLLQNNGDAKSLSVIAKVATGDSSTPHRYGDTAATGLGYLTDKDITRLQHISGVASVTPAYSIQATYMVGPNKVKYETTVSVKADQTSMKLAAGSLTTNQPQPGTVVVAKDYLRSLGFSSAQEAIGKTVTLHFNQQSVSSDSSASGKDMDFTIAAVNEKSQTIINYQSGVWVGPVDGKAIYEYQMASETGDRFYNATIRVADNADIDKVQQAVKQAGYGAYSIKDVQETLFTFVNVVMSGVAGFGALAILASVFGIINTQYISVLERTQQIGLMKALGARRRDIGRLFRYEAAWVGFLGGLIGTLLALPVGLLNPRISNLLGLEEGTKLIIFNPTYSVLLIIGLMAVSVVAGWLPSRKAAKLDPIEALRTE